MTEIRLGLWLGILSSFSLLALNWGCADVIGHVTRGGEEIREAPVSSPPPILR